MSGQTLESAFHGISEVRPCRTDRGMHFTAWLVACEDLIDAPVEVEPLTGRTSGHVGVDQRVQQRRVFTLVRFQLGDQTALLSFEDRAGVMRHQADEPTRSIERFEVPSTVERVKAGLSKLRGVAEVMKPGSSDEQAPLILWHCCGRFAGALRDSLRVQPAVTERGQQRLGELGRSARRVQR